VVQVRTWWRVNRWLLLAVLLVALALYAGLKVLSTRAVASASQPVATVPVLVVTTPIAADSPVSPADVSVRQYPANLAPPGIYRGAVTGLWAAEALAPGEVLLQSQVFSPKSSDIIADRLPVGMVAFDLALPPSSTVDGVIAPGDHVTILATVNQVSEVFLSHVRVLGINGSLSGAPAAGAAEQLILALSLRDAEALAFAETHGTLSVVLERPGSPPSKTASYGPGWPAPPGG